MPLPLIAAAAPSIASFIGGLFNARSANNQRQEIIDQLNEQIQYLRSQGISNPQEYLNSVLLPLLQNSQTALSAFGGQAIDESSDLGSRLAQFLDSTVPNLAMPGDLMSYYNSPFADVGRRYDDVLGFLTGQMYNAPDQYGNAMGRLNEMILGQDQGLDALLQRGNNLMDSWGQTGYNVNAQDAAGRSISAGGWTPQLDALRSRGQSLFDTGGMTPDLAGLSSLGGLAQNFLPGSSPFGQSQVLGPQGLQTIDMLLNGGGPTLNYGLSNDQLNSGYNAAISRLNDTGYTPQNSLLMQMGAQGLNDLLQRNGQLDEARLAAQQAFSGNLPGTDTFGNALEGLIGQLSSGASSGYGLGGGGGAGAGYAAGIGAYDPELLDILRTGADRFKREELLPMQQMVSMARDAAAISGRQGAEAAARYAAGRAGANASNILNASTANRLASDYSFEQAALESQAVRDAMLKRQELGLQQQTAGGQIALGAANADTSRQQAQIQANIANANNQTQASVANAQIANQQAQIAAQLRQAGLTAALNAALGARGQNYSRSQSGLEALQNIQSIANQRGSIFEDLAKSALSDATQRFGASSQTGANLLSNLFQTDAQRTAAQGQFQNERLLGALSGLVNASQIGATSSNNTLASLIQGSLGANQIAAGRIGMGLDAVNNASTSANNALNIFGNIGNAASQDQLSRMVAGSNMVGQNITARQNAANLLGAMLTSQNNSTVNLGQLFNNAAGQQGNVWSRMFDMDFANRQLQQQGTIAGLGNSMNFLGQLLTGMQAAQNPLSSLASGFLGYMGNQQSGANGLLGQLAGMAPAYQNPFPQVQIDPSTWYSSATSLGSATTPPFVGGSNPFGNVMGSSSTTLGNPFHFPTASTMPYAYFGLTP